MCIIICQPAGKEIPLEHFVEAAASNRDGMGMMYVRDEKLVVQKQLKNPDSFYGKYLEVRELDTPVVVHFRIGTSGAKNLANCHPFYINDNLGFCHNGVLGKGKGSKSDTRVWADDIIRRLPEGWFDNNAILCLMEDAIGSDKMVFLNNKQESAILGRHRGHWNDGIWYSNKSYVPVIPINKSKHKEKRSSTALVPAKKDPKFPEPKVQPGSSNPYLWNANVWCYNCIPIDAYIEADVKIINTEVLMHCTGCEVALRQTPEPCRQNS